MTTYTVTGTDGRGRVHHAERTPAASAHRLAEALYDLGWTEADITLDGEVVGQVTVDLRGVRTWWGNKAGMTPVVVSRQRVRPNRADRRAARRQVES